MATKLKKKAGKKVKPQAKPKTVLGPHSWWKDIEVLSSTGGVIHIAHTLAAARELRSRGYVPNVELW
jgi:hypothetical protein